MSISNTQILQTEVVIQPAVITNDFIITNIHENIKRRIVFVDVEFGPFKENVFDDGRVILNGSHIRKYEIWKDNDYDLIRDTWTNKELIAAATSIIANSINNLV